MDSDDQSRVFKRVQSKFKVDEITPDKVNEFLRNKPEVNREYTWDENHNGKLRTVTREYKSEGFSSKKDAIAEAMSEISVIYDDAKKYGSLKDSNKVQERVKGFGFDLTSDNVSLIDKADFQRASELMDDLFNAGDIGGYRMKFDNPLVQERADNEVLNLVSSKARGLRDQGDIGGLEDLKEESKGIRFYDEAVKAINEALSSSRKKLERFEKIDVEGG